MFIRCLVFLAATLMLQSIFMLTANANDSLISQCYSRVLSNPQNENESISSQLPSERFVKHNSQHNSQPNPQQKTNNSSLLTDQNVYQDLDLSIHSANAVLPDIFEDQLAKRITTAHGWLSSLLPDSTQQNVTVNLWVFNDVDDYRHFKHQQVPHLTANSIGFHSSRKNIAAVLQKNNDQVLYTSLHEAVHVINSGMFGYLPRWVNEGLAEYVEDMTIEGQRAVVEPKQVWLNEVNKSPLDLEFVLSSGYKQWNEKNRRSLYAHSWAMMYFLMSQEKNQVLLQDYFAENVKLPCQRLDSARYFANHYSGGLSRMEEDFKSWLKQDKQTHTF